MYNERLFYLLSVEKIASDDIKPTCRANALDSKLSYSKCSPPVMVLASRQSLLDNPEFEFSD